MTRKPRTYTYRVPLDDKAAWFRLRRFERKSEYCITKISKKRDVPNGRAVKNWGCLFFQSRETSGDYPGEYEGGVIPGLEEYRYSLDWEPTPETELLEMKRASTGGTKIRGEQFLGTSDPRLSDYVPVETVVPWTVGEIKAMFDGEDVPNRVEYSHDPPMMASSEARREYRRLIEVAIDEGFKDMQRNLYEMEEACDHDHAIETTRGGYCEDCGRSWEDERDMEHDEVTIVGTA